MRANVSLETSFRHGISEMLCRNALLIPLHTSCMPFIWKSWEQRKITQKWILKEQFRLKSRFFITAGEARRIFFLPFSRRKVWRRKCLYDAARWITFLDDPRIRTVYNAPIPSSDLRKSLKLYKTPFWGASCSRWIIFLQFFKGSKTSKISNEMTKWSITFKRLQRRLRTPCKYFIY